jgi:DNA-binding MarR family transcriptional regulator
MRLAPVNAGARIILQQSIVRTVAKRRKSNGGPRGRHIDFSLGGRLGYLVRDANRAFQRLLEKRIAPHGVTRGQWYFLRVLWEEDGLSQRELSARVGMMEPTTVIALRGMEKFGLIRRARSADDRRIARVHLTPKAKRLRSRLLRISRGVNEQGAGGIDAAKLDEFRRVVARMMENLDRIER